MVRAFFLGLREVFTLQEAERRARASTDDERAKRAPYVRAAKARRRAARRLADPVAANILLRDALDMSLRACGRSLEEVAPASDVARVKEAMSATSPLAFDELSFARGEALRSSFETCIRAVIGEADPPSLFAVRVSRVARALGVIALVGWLVVPWVRSHWLVHNVALGKTVTSSPLLAESPSPDHLVDGKTRGTFDIATVQMDHPFVAVDLEDVYRVDRVVVVNRGDGWFDDCLPLVMSVSTDGVRFDDVARRDDHFDRWTVLFHDRPIRAVRLYKPDRGYIALEEIEVYGRP